MRFCVLILLWFFAGIAPGQQRGGFEAETEAALQNQRCPPLRLTTLSGAAVTLPPRDGITVVTFFTS